MDVGHPQPYQAEHHHSDRAPFRHDGLDLKWLVEENARLRELVVRLSDMILRSMVERH